MSINVGRSRKPLKELRDMITRDKSFKNVKYIAIQEPHAHIDNIPGFQYFRHDQAKAAMYVKTDIVAHLINTFDLNMTGIKSGNLIILSIYVIPECRTTVTLGENRFKKIEKTLNFLSTLGEQCQNIIITGDFNARHVTWDSRSNGYGEMLSDFCASSNFSFAFPSTPTFHNHNGVSIIDGTLQTMFGCKVTTIPIASAEHMLIKSVFEMTSQVEITTKPRGKRQPNTRKYDTSAAAIGKFKLYLEENIDKAKEIKTFKEMIDLFTKGAEEKPKKKLRQPYVRSEIAKRQASVVRHLKKVIGKTVSETQTYNRQKMIFAQGKLQETLDNDDEASWNVFLANNHDWGKAYKFVKGEAVGKASNVEFPGLSQDETTENLKSFFPEIQVCQDDECERERTGWSKRVSSIWLREKIMYMNPNKAPGLDFVNGFMIATASEISTYNGLMARFLTKKIQDGVSQDLKTSHLCTIPKAGKTDYEKPNSHRLLCLMSVFGRINSSFVVENLESIVNKKFHDSQHGFRIGKSCITALTHLNEKVRNAAKRQKALICFDFTAAFDRVRHEDIFQQLEE